MDTAITKFDFHGDVLDVACRDGQVFVSVKRICDALGLDMGGQLVKLKGKPWAVMEIISMTASDSKKYSTSCIALRSLPMWLATIEPTRVAVEVRVKLERYQLECAEALANHFLGKQVGRGGQVSLEKALGEFLLRMERVISGMEGDVVYQTQLMLRETEESIMTKVMAQFAALPVAVPTPVLPAPSVAAGLPSGDGPVGYELGVEINESITELARELAPGAGRTAASMRKSLDMMLRRQVNHVTCWRELERGRLQLVRELMDQVRNKPQRRAEQMVAGVFGE